MTLLHLLTVISVHFLILTLPYLHRLLDPLAMIETDINTYEEIHYRKILLKSSISAAVEASQEPNGDYAIFKG